MTRYLLVLFLFFCTAFAQDKREVYFMVNVFVDSLAERNQVANTGVAIEAVLSDSVTFFGNAQEVAQVKRLGFSMEVHELPERWLRRTRQQDAAYHDYGETLGILDGLAKSYPALVQRVNIGKSVEGRELAGVRISSKAEHDSLPTALFMGCHHARERLSVEVPLKLATWLAENYGKDERVTRLLDTREVWVVPMVNPDGVEYDLSGWFYRYWRKNRKENGNGTFGVDLNRNYAKGWGGEGASSSPGAQTYHGEEAFSEPETRAVRDFVRARKKTTVLLSYHSFAELVIWPWGHTEAVIPNEADRNVFEAMGQKMASWNGYKPIKASELYVASGDTGDWAYDELGIFAFTFELSPSSVFEGGFYPGPSAIEPTFQNNLEPALYLIENAEDPYAVVRQVQDPLGIL